MWDYKRRLWINLSFLRCFLTSFIPKGEHSRFRQAIRRHVPEPLLFNLLGPQWGMGPQRYLSSTGSCPSPKLAPTLMLGGGGGVGVGGIPIHKISLRDVPPFRVWFFDRPLINRVSNSKIFEDSRNRVSNSKIFEDSRKNEWNLIWKL